MRCNEYFIWMSGHLDGTNSEREEESLQQHLRSCPQCRQTMEDMKANDAILQRDTLTPPETIMKTVMASVRKDAKKKSSRIRSYIVSIAAAAAVLCLVLVASLRIPERPDADPTAGASQAPADTVYESAEGFTAAPVEEAEPDPLSAEPIAVAEDRNTKGIEAHTPSPYNCVFVALPSQDKVPQEYPSLLVEEFYSRITQEAQDMYYYGGSIIYGAALMTYEEMLSWEAQIQFRFMHDGADPDTYVVVFCSESR